MGKPIARVGDPWVGTCSNHNQPIPVSGNVSDTPNSFVNDEGVLVAVDGANCPASCGHTATLIASSILTTIDGIKLGLLGDQVQGAGIIGNIVEGSKLTISD